MCPSALLFIMKVRSFLKRGTPLLILNKGSDHKHFCKTVLLDGFVSGEKIKEGNISLHSFCVKRTIIVVI